MKKIIGKALAALSMLAIAGHVSGLELKRGSSNGKSILLLTGEFKPGDSRSFSSVIDSAGRIDEIWFDSPGGSVEDGMAIGRKIRSLKLATRIPKGASCDSICAFAFLGGVIRDVDPGGAYGVHMFSGWCGPEKKQAIYQAITSTFQSAGCNKQSIAALTLAIAEMAQSEEQKSAIIARHQADYLMEMEVSLRLLIPNYETGVACGQTNQLSRSQLLSFNVINTGG
jgi:hypothetical protein